MSAEVERNQFIFNSTNLHGAGQLNEYYAFARWSFKLSVLMRGAYFPGIWKGQRTRPVATWHPSLVSCVRDRESRSFVIPANGAPELDIGPTEAVVGVTEIRTFSARNYSLPSSAATPFELP